MGGGVYGVLFKAHAAQGIFQRLEPTAMGRHAVDHRSYAHAALTRRLQAAQHLHQRIHGVDVDGRRQHRDDDGVGDPHQVGKKRVRGPGGCIHDDALGIQGHAQLEAAGHAHRILICSDAVDGRSRLGAQLQPAGAGALGVVIEERLDLKREDRDGSKSVEFSKKC